MSFKSRMYADWPQGWVFWSPREDPPSLEAVHWGTESGKTLLYYCRKILLGVCNTEREWKEICSSIKGTVSRDFLLLVFLWISFSLAPEYQGWICLFSNIHDEHFHFSQFFLFIIRYPIKTVSNFFEISRRYSQLKVDHRCRWHRWQMKKIFNQKNFINFVGTPLDSRVNIYINFCLQVHF
jgi:hypothetical protein